MEIIRKWRIEIVSHIQWKKSKLNLDPSIYLLYQNNLLYYNVFLTQTILLSNFHLNRKINLFCSR